MTIDTELANAKNILKITSVDEVKRTQLAETMASHFLDLQNNYLKLTLEQKLFLMTLALNLMLYAYENNETGKKLEYKHKIVAYNDDLFGQSQLVLTDIQQAQWSIEVAKIHQQSRCRAAVNSYYEQALKFIKSAAKSAKSKSLIKSLLLDVYLRMAEHNTESATYFETEELAPDLAYQANERVITATKVAVRLVNDQASLTQLYFMDVQALDKLASQNEARKNKPKKAVELWIKALEAAMAGLSIAKSSEDQERFLSLIKSCNKKLLIVTTQPSIKELSNSLVPALEKLTNWLKEAPLEKISELQLLAKAIAQTTFSETKSTPFWHTPKQNELSTVAEKAIQIKIGHN